MNIITIAIMSVFSLLMLTSLAYAEVSHTTSLDNDPLRPTTEYFALISFEQIRISDTDIFFEGTDDKPDYLKNRTYDLLYVLEEGEKLVVQILHTQNTSTTWEVWELRENATKQFLPVFGGKILFDANSVDWRDCEYWNDLDCFQLEEP